jgi:predicted glutamine amidotransferase
MCRLFGMSAGSEPTSASFWLLEAPDSLLDQSRREPDGTGLGWFDEKRRPHVEKQPIAAFDDASFAQEAKTVSSSTFLAHIRFASTGELTLANTHPFELDGRLFAHNGVIEGLSALDEHLGADLRLVQGETDSERFFALITREIRRADGDVAAGIESACGWISANLPLLSINFILTTAAGLWALRYPETHDLYVLEREPGEALEHRSSLTTRVHSEEGAERPLVVLASERMDDDPGWEMLRGGELLHVDSELRLSRRRILEAAPAKPLTLADLAPKARASQAHQSPS